MQPNGIGTIDQYWKPKNKQERQARNRIWTRYNAMKDDDLRREQESDWDMADKMFKQWMPQREEGDWRSHIALPDGFAAVQAHMQETINRKSRPILKLSQSSDFAREMFINCIFSFAMDRTGFDLQVFFAKQAAAIRGTAFVMEYYRLEKRDVHDPTGVNDDGTLKYQKKEVVDYDDVYTEFKENELIFVDPVKHIDYARDMVEREVLDWDEFQRVYGKRADFMNVNKVPKAGAISTQVQFFKMPHDITDDDVEILHYYNRATDSYDSLANNVLVRLGYLPSKHKELPLGVFTHYNVPGHMWGMGIPKVIFSLTEERKSLRNLNLDRNHMSVDKMFLTNDLVDLDDEDVRTRPNGFIPVNTNGLRLSDVIQPIEYGDTPASYYQAENMLLEDIRRAHGIADQLQAVQQGGTATESAMLQQAAQARIAMVNTLAEMDVIVRIGKLKWSNIQFFYPAPKVETITEDDDEREVKTYKRINVDGKEFNIGKDQNGNSVLKVSDIDGSSGFNLNRSYARFMSVEADVTVDAEGQTSMPKPLRQAKVTEMMNTLVLNPLLASTLDPNKAVKRYVTVMDEDPKDWMRDKGMTKEDWKRLAIHENMVMAAGQPLAPTEGATTEHTEEHLNFTQTSTYDALPDTAKAIFMEHITGEHQNNPTTGDVSTLMNGLPAPPGGAGGAPSEAGGGALPAPVPQGGTAPAPNVGDMTPSTPGGADRQDSMVAAAGGGQ